MIVKAKSDIRIGYGSYITVKAMRPVRNRVLVEVKGRNHVALFTFPADCVTVDKGAFADDKVFLKEGTYKIIETTDKRNNKIYKFFVIKEETNLWLVAFDGFINKNVSKAIAPLVEVEGRSNSGNNGSRWSLNVAEDGAFCCIRDYGEYKNRYYRIVDGEVIYFGSTEAELEEEEF